MSKLLKDKWVRIMCDFSATGVWSKSGSLANLDDLPVGADVFFRLGVWQHWYESRKHDDPISNLDKFVKYGLDIAQDIKAQLPDWTVVYVDESKLHTDPAFTCEITEGEPYNPWADTTLRGK